MCSLILYSSYDFVAYSSWLFACLLMLVLDFPVAFTFGGYAPESAAMGAVGAIILALMGRITFFHAAPGRNGSHPN